MSDFVRRRLNDDAVPTILNPEIIVDVQQLGSVGDVQIPSSVSAIDIDSAGSSQVSIGGSPFGRKRQMNDDEITSKRQKLMLEHNYWSSRSPRYWMDKYRKCSDNYVKLNKKTKIN